MLNTWHLEQLPERDYSLQQLHQEMGGEKKPIQIIEDNQAAIAIAKNQVHYSREKHTDVQHHLIQEEVNSRHISVTYCPTKQVVVGILTKCLPQSHFEIFRKALALQHFT